MARLVRSLMKLATPSARMHHNPHLLLLSATNYPKNNYLPHHLHRTVPNNTCATPVIPVDHQHVAGSPLVPKIASY